MSADLLDLDSFYSSPPAPQQPQQQQKQQGAQFGQLAQPQPQRPQQVTTSSTDLFDFSSFMSNTTVTSRPAAAAAAAAPPAPAQQTQPWPDFQTQTSSNAGGWGDFSAFESAFASSTPTQKQPQQQKPQQKQQDDDDDGWGDFEVAEPTPTQRSFVLPPQTNKARSSPPPRTRVARASTFDLMSNNLVNVIDMPPGAGLSPIPSPGLPSPGWQQQQQQPNRGPSPGLSWQTGSGALKPPPSPGLTSQTGPVPKPQPSPRLRGQMPEFSKKPASSPKPPKKSDSNILFDAEEFELQGGNDDDDDDFGDFETVQTPFPGGNMSPTLDSKPRQQRQQQIQKAQPPPSMDLLSLDDDPLTISQPEPQPKKLQLSTLSLDAPISPYPQAPKSPSFQERNPFPGLGLTTPTSADFKKDEKPKSPSPVTAWPSFGQTSPKKASTTAKKGPSTTAAAKPTKFEDDWGDFEAFADEPSAIDSSKPPESWDWDAVDGVKSPEEPATTIEALAQPTPATEPAPEARDDAPPPINIPPPSVLLSIFPQLLETANTSLFKPLTGQMPPVKKKILSDPTTVTFLRGYLALATVAARVIAGRKLRWHRDKFLSQGMAISAAGAKGMKLAGVDKAQAAREDREAADVVGVWKENVGRLRSAIVTANSALKHEQLRVPELSETMPVSTAKVVPTAPKPCIVCGLKRDERVSKVDVDVEDSFGEWWVGHWGHRSCKNFWVEHEKQLRQR
ncbi:serine threonine-protein kinase ppk6 [Colletotrichum sojae]|uniref:Serine threonine-protein kinase ppk6 n=1 Tax=Colletotrichum sojae TaxID=2175907 RepID=A0A8H6N4C0_9PEZI|nr:serine threonine-protein kinase ppk6 [Colletotrichum sojae]